MIEPSNIFWTDQEVITNFRFEDLTKDIPNTLWIGEQKEPMTLQTIIISKSYFKTLSLAHEKAKHFTDGPMKSGDETTDSFRFRVRDPGMFKDASFRTIHPTQGVALVLGTLK